MEETKFTWFPKLTNTLNEIAKDFPELVGEFALAVSNYGTFGIMPEFSNIALKYAFYGVKDDIDNSINARKNGKRGGQNKGGGSAPTEGGLETSQGGLNTSEGGLDTLEEPVKGGSAPTEAPYTVNQTIPVHTNNNTSQDKKEINKEKKLCTDVVSYLNTQAGTSYKPTSDSTQRHIRARIHEGFTFDDFKAVIDNRIQAWKDDPSMSEYIRPSTLFGTKFESYLNADSVKEVAKNEFARFR